MKAELNFFHKTIQLKMCWRTEQSVDARYEGRDATMIIAREEDPANIQTQVLRNSRTERRRLIALLLQQLIEMDVEVDLNTEVTPEEQLLLSVADSEETNG